MKRFLVMISLLVAPLFLGAPALAQQSGSTPPVPVVSQFDADAVAEIEFLLSGYHELAPKERFEQVSDARGIVEALARGSRGLIRDRALAALGRYWPNADVFLLYAGVVAADDTPYGTRHRTMMMMATSFDERALPVLERYLSHSDVQLRITAVRALAAIGTDAAHQAILDRVAVEKNKLVLEHIDEAARHLR